MPSPPPPLLDKSKCFSKECFPEVAEKDYLKEYSDPHGYVQSCNLLTVVSNTNLFYDVFLIAQAWRYWRLKWEMWHRLHIYRALKSMASLGIFPFHNLTIKVYVYTAADVEAVQELTTGKSMSLTVCSIGMWGTQVNSHINACCFVSKSFLCLIACMPNRTHALLYYVEELHRESLDTKNGNYGIIN